jgi:hypothetical protein
MMANAGHADAQDLQDRRWAGFVGSVLPSEDG